MSTKYIEARGTAAGDAATVLGANLKTDAAGNVYPIIFDAVDGILKYYDRVRSKVAQIGLLNQAPVTAITTLAVTEALHAGRTILLDLVGGFTSTLPAATGSGNRYRFVNKTASNAYVIATDGTGKLCGGVMVNDAGASSAVQAYFFRATVASHTQYAPTTAGGGGAIGDWVEFQDIDTNVWAVSGQLQTSTDPANPFS